MAEELITYGMIRDKNYTVPTNLDDSEYAIKADFELGGEIGLYAGLFLNNYDSMELLPDSAIPIREESKRFIIRSNKAGTVYLTNYSLRFNTNPDSLTSRPVFLGNNTITLPVTVSRSTGGSASLDVGSRIYIYEKANLGNNLLANYIIVNGGTVTVTLS